MSQFGMDVDQPKAAIMPKEMMQTCLSCPLNCAECYQPKSGQAICTDCNSPYLLTDGKCIEDQVHSIDLVVDSHVYQRCDDIVIHVSNKYRASDFKWSIDVKGIEASPSEIQKIEKYFEGQGMLIIPRKFTEQFSEGGEVIVTLKMMNNGQYISET